MGDVQMTHGLDEVVALFRSADDPWGIAGGWAIDLHLGELGRRQHSDVDVVWPFSAADELRRRLSDWDLQLVVDGVFEAWVESLGSSHQIWVRPDSESDWAFEVMFEHLDDEVWRFRRNPDITVPISQYLVDCGGTPTVDLAVTLLWKAVRADDQDHRDLLDAIHLLDDARREWLHDAIRSTHGSDHRWLGLLGGAG